MARAAFLLLLALAVLLPPGTARGEETAGLFRLWREGQIAQLAPRLAAAMARHPEDVDLQLLEGLLALGEEQAERARAAFAAVLARAPDYDDARIGLARAELRLGDAEAAHAVLAPLAWRIAEDPDLLALFLRIHLARGRRDLAEAVFWHFCALHARDPAMLEAAGEIALRTGLRRPRPNFAAAADWRAFAYARREWSDGDPGRGEARLALIHLHPDGSSLLLATDWRRRSSREEAAVEIGQGLPFAAGDLRLTLALAPSGRTLPLASGEVLVEAPAFGGIGTTPPVAGLHLALRRYRDGTAVMGGPQLRFAPGGAELHLRADLARDAGGRLDVGAGIRVDVPVSGSLQLSLAAGWLRDVEDAGKAEHGYDLSLGWSRTLPDGMRLFCDLTVTARRNGAVATGCGVALRMREDGR